MKDNFHPSRSELIQAARQSSPVFEKHMAACNWCQLYLELLTRFQMAGQLPFVSAPEAWVNRAVSIAAKSGLMGDIKRLVARITFDSWAMPVPEGARGEALIQERRIRFEANDKLFDLRAEHRKNHWDFTAKVTDRGGLAVDCTVIAGKKELSADKNGFYQWTSIKPPRDFKIVTETDEIVVPELMWKKSPQE